MLRNFNGKPSEKAILLAIASRAEGCVASAKTAVLIGGANTSPREFYRCVARMEEAGDILRLSPRRGGAVVRAFHLERFCSAKFLEGDPAFSLLCPRKQSAVPDIRNIGTTLLDWQSRPLPFPRMGFVREKCEECRGTGSRLVPRPDGLPGQVAIPCTHRIAAIAGQWRPAEDWQTEDWEGEQRRRTLLTRENSICLNQQESFNWERVEIDTQKAALKEWLQRHPEATLPTNVIVIRRKTA